MHERKGEKIPGIGDLVTNLTVDNTGFKKGLSGARSSLKSFAGGIGGIIGPLAGMLAGIWGTSAAISGAKEALQNQRKLAAVLESTGGAAGFTTAQISEYAGELQDLTNYEDDATVGAAAMLASFTNVRGDLFKGALEGAMNLDTVMGGGLETNVKLLGKALEDPTAGLTRLTKAGIIFSDSQKKSIEALQASGNLLGAQEALLGAVEAKFGGAAKAVADPWTQFTNVLGDVGENIGATLLPSINVLSEGLSSMLSVVVSGSEWFKSLGIEAAVVLSHMGSALLDVVAPAVDFVLSGIKDLFGVVVGGSASFQSLGIEATVMLTHIGGLIELGATQWELFFVELANNATHFFTDVIPTYLTWFGDNWSKVLFTAGDYAMTVFMNLGTNIKNLWQTVLDFFAGNEVKFNWTDLGEGAKSAIDKLPDIPERLTTAFEEGLKSDIASMSESLGTSMEDQRKTLTESMNAQRAELEKTFSPLAKVPAFNAPEADAGDATTKTKVKKDLKAAFAGSSEAASIMLRGVGGGKSIEAIAKKQLTVAENQLQVMKANKPQEMFAINFGAG